MAVKYMHNPGSFTLDPEKWQQQQQSYNSFASANPAVINAMQTQDYSGLNPWQSTAAKNNDWSFLAKYPTQDAYQSAMNAQNVGATGGFTGGISSMQSDPYAGMGAQQYFDAIIGLNDQGNPNRAATTEEARRIYDLAAQEGITADQISAYFGYDPGTIANYIQQQGWAPLTGKPNLPVTHTDQGGLLTTGGNAYNQGGGQQGGLLVGQSGGGSSPRYTYDALYDPTSLWTGLIGQTQDPSYTGPFTSGNMGTVSPYWNPEPYRVGWDNDAFGTGWRQLNEMITNPPNPYPSASPTMASDPQIPLDGEWVGEGSDRRFIQRGTPEWHDYWWAIDSKEAGLK